MIEIIKYNDDDLKDTEIDEVVTRIKAFIVSSKNNMIVGFTPSDGYQLIGGYVEDGQDLVETLKDIVYDASGIVLDSRDTIEPFYEIRQYSKDYKGSGLNRMSDLIYFFVGSDKLPNLKKLKLSERELAEKVPLEIIRRSSFKNVLNEYIESEQDQLKKVKAKELLLAFEKFKEIYKF